MVVLQLEFWTVSDDEVAGYTSASLLELEHNITAALAVKHGAGIIGVMCGRGSLKVAVVIAGHKNGNSCQEWKSIPGIELLPGLLSLLLGLPSLM